MRLGLMQPYFFPYAQQFRHIAQCDLWVVFDTVRYRRRTWTTRNRILNRDKGWAYVGVPMERRATHFRLSQAPIVADPSPLGGLLERLRVYQGAPFYEPTRDLVTRILSDPEPTIAGFNTHCLRALCEYLGVRTRVVRLSELDLPLPAEAEPDMWALLISRALGASVYSNAPGGRSLYRPEPYREAGLSLEFYAPRELRYDTGSFDFQPDLSVLDSLMWMPHAALRDFVQA
ncbi:MAG: WbqC family protein [Myxococcales bacterium]|nr:WbqC family protein [Myxococcales bacterium]MDD9967730.1 WbqC family protein [Myxococcales bacterium]